MITTLVLSRGTAQMARIDPVLKMAVQAKASDLHVATGMPYVIRQFGRLKKGDSKELSPESSRSLIYEILSPKQRQILEENLQLDFSYQIEGLARFRGNVILQRERSGCQLSCHTPQDTDIG